jgi:hypothetical protein
MPGVSRRYRPASTKLPTQVPYRQPEQEDLFALSKVDAQAGDGPLLRAGAGADAVHVALAHPEDGVARVPQLL